MSPPSDRRFDPRPDRGRPGPGNGPAGRRPPRPGVGRFGPPRPRREGESGGESPWQRSGERPWRSPERGGDRPAPRSLDRPRPRSFDRPGERPADRPGERGERGDRPFRAGPRFERSERPERGPRFGRPDRPPGAGDRLARAARPGRPERPGRPDRFSRPDRFGASTAERGPEGRQPRFPRRPFREGPPSEGRRAERSAGPVFAEVGGPEPRGEAASHAPDAATDLIWGRHAALATLESGRPVHRIWCTPEMRFSPRFLQLLREAKASGVLVEEVTWARLGQISSGGVHQGIVLQPAAAESLDLPTLLEGCRELAEAPLLIALDGLTDPQNLGSIVRSTEALGAHGMVLPQRRSAGLTGSVAKVAAGALEHLPVARVVNLNRALDALKQEGYRVVGLAGEGSLTLEEADLSGPLVIVTGSEGEGLSMLTRRSCDQLVRVPLRGATPSLNAGVATALVLYEVARRGWMHGLTGSAPAPRLVRPALPAPPAPSAAPEEPEGGSPSPGLGERPAPALEGEEAAMAVAEDAVPAAVAEGAVPLAVAADPSLASADPFPVAAVPDPVAADPDPVDRPSWMPAPASAMPMPEAQPSPQERLPQAHEPLLESGSHGAPIGSFSQPLRNSEPEREGVDEDEDDGEGDDEAAVQAALMAEPASDAVDAASEAQEPQAEPPSSEATPVLGFPTPPTDPFATDISL